RGDDRAALVLGCGVVCLAEIHDVDAMRSEGGPDRRCRCGLPPRDLDPHHRCQSFLSQPELFFFFFYFATWPSSSSTGVSRPKMFTNTVSFERATSMSLIEPWKSANGPVTTRTCSPTSYARRGRTFFSWPGSITPTPRMDSTSFLDSGVGR